MPLETTRARFAGKAHWVKATGLARNQSIIFDNDFNASALPHANKAIHICAFYAHHGDLSMISFSHVSFVYL